MDVVEFALKNGVPLSFTPGALTPTEVIAAWVRRVATYVKKIFPCAAVSAVPIMHSRAESSFAASQS